MLKLLILPPGCFFVLFLAALGLRRWRPRLGRAALWSLLAVVYLVTTPFVAGELMAPLQCCQPVDPEKPDPAAGAIVVLGAGIYFSAPEYWTKEAPPFGVDVANTLSLERVAYAAYLARATGKPILLSGGAGEPPTHRTIAEAMGLTLLRNFGLTARWMEKQSTTTLSNAVYSAQILRKEGITRIYLVTHAWHMRRALIAFEGTGLEVIPAPTAFVSRSGADPDPGDFVPSARALLFTYYAVHEWLGIIWYRTGYAT
jgi:uncharacterized SAM-binding protein YcdF (DUF218 family)